MEKAGSFHTGSWGMWTALAALSPPDCVCICVDSGFILHCQFPVQGRQSPVTWWWSKSASAEQDTPRYLVAADSPWKFAHTMYIYICWYCKLAKTAGPIEEKNLCPIRSIYVSLTGGETLRSRRHRHAPLCVAVERCKYTLLPFNGPKCKTV